MRRTIGLGLIGLVCMAAAASADDLSPPPWDRSDPYAVTAHWEFNTPDMSLPPDGPLTNLTNGGGAQTLLTLLPMEPGMEPIYQEGAWYFPYFTSMDIVVDNVIDDYPVKHLQIQYTYVSGAFGAPGAYWIEAYDPTGEVTYVYVGTTEWQIPGTNQWQHVATYDLFPNPDYEVIHIDLYEGTLLSQVIVDTISVPEPATLALVGLGVAGLVARRRRSK